MTHWGTQGIIYAAETDFLLTHHQYVRDCFEEIHEFGEAVVAELALTTEVMVVGRDELTEWHSAVRLVTEKIDHLLSKLLGALHLLHCTLCRKIKVRRYL